MKKGKKVLLFLLISTTCHVACFVSFLITSVLEVEHTEIEKIESALSEIEILNEEGGVLANGTIYKTKTVNLTPLPETISEHSYTIDSSLLVLTILGSLVIHTISFIALTQKNRL